MSSHWLVTGGAGFAGSHLVKELVERGHKVTVLDSLTYAGSQAGLAEVSSRINFVYHDFSQPLPDLGSLDYVVHNGAESHVLRSLRDPGLFVRSNVLGTLNVLEWARRQTLKKFVYVSTDEVFGPEGSKPWDEGDLLRPTNPYSASKAGGEYLTHSYFRSFGIPAVITRTVNMFGERQHPEKFVPLVIKRLLKNEVVDVHINRQGEVGSRHWLYAGEQARAIIHLAEHSFPGTINHVASEIRKSNHEMALLLAQILGRTLNYRLVEYEWPGHDLHYAIKGSPQAAAWKMTESFGSLLTKTVNWYQRHPEWLA